MKSLLLILLIVFSFSASAQRYYRVDPVTGEYQAISTADSLKVYASKFPNRFWFFTDSIGLKAMDSAHHDGSPTTVLWAKNNGLLQISKLDSMLGRALVYDSLGQITKRPLKIWKAVVNATSGNGFPIDISSAGFTAAPLCYITPLRNTSNANDLAVVNIKTITTTTVTVAITIQIGNAFQPSMLEVLCIGY